MSTDHVRQKVTAESLSLCAAEKNTGGTDIINEAPLGPANVPSCTTSEV